ARPHLDLDDRDQVATTRDEVDLAKLGAVTPLDDAVAFHHQGKGGDPFAAMSATLVMLALVAGANPHRLSVPSAGGIGPTCGPRSFWRLRQLLSKRQAPRPAKAGAHRYLQPDRLLLREAQHRRRS